MSITDRIRKPGPKRILALDGGGIRGMITVEILARLEALLKPGGPAGAGFVLADYFDFIAGTSTGAIIAACLARGMTVSELRDFYVGSGAQMFDKASLFRQFRYRYEDDKLAGKLQEIFRESSGRLMSLGSEEIRSVLMMVMRNATTDSPWPVSNNPLAKYNLPARRAAAFQDCNLDLPLWQLVRASTAAPVYFPPEVIRIGRLEHIFVDGGITPYNNPAFQAFLMATVEPYAMNWATGEDRMLVVSLGTGTNPNANADLEPGRMNLLYNAGSIPSALMFAALNEQDFLCRVFGRCLAGPLIDSEVGDLIGQGGPVRPKLFTYVRYNAELNRPGLDALGLHQVEPEAVQKLDSIEFIPQLQEVGRAVADRQVDASHFAGFPA